MHRPRSCPPNLGREFASAHLGVASAHLGNSLCAPQRHSPRRASNPGALAPPLPLGAQGGVQLLVGWLAQDGVRVRRVADEDRRRDPHVVVEAANPLIGCGLAVHAEVVVGDAALVEVPPGAGRVLARVPPEHDDAPRPAARLRRPVRQFGLPLPPCWPPSRRNRSISLMRSSPEGRRASSTSVSSRSTYSVVVSSRAAAASSRTRISRASSGRRPKSSSLSRWRPSARSRSIDACGYSPDT